MMAAASSRHFLAEFLFAVACMSSACVETRASVAAPAATQSCEKREALDSYLRRVAAGTTGFERAEEPGSMPRAPGPSAFGSVNLTAVNYQGCAHPGAEEFAFCDMSLPTVERVEDLLSRMSLDQKLGMISPNPTLGSTCQGYTWNGTSLASGPMTDDQKFLAQVITYVWLNEANTNVQSSCWKGWDGKENKCSTNIGGPNSIASTWNRTVFYQKGVIISTEQRSLRMVGGTNHVGKTPMSVMGFGPNINIQRDRTCFSL